MSYPEGKKPVGDVWLKTDYSTPIEDDEDYEVTHEANTYEFDGQFIVEWYLNAVGLVTQVWFKTLDEAYEWYAREGFEDFSSGE